MWSATTAMPPERLESLGKASTLQLDDVPNALNLEGRFLVEGLRLAPDRGRPLDRGVEHALGAGVDAEDGLARDHVGDVHEGPPLADVAPLVAGLELQARRIGSGNGGRSLRELAVAQPPAAGAVVDEMLDGFAFPGRHAPDLGRRGHQHVPRRGPDLAHGLEVVAHAVGAVGVLVTVAIVGRGPAPPARGRSRPPSRRPRPWAARS